MPDDILNIDYNIRALVVKALNKYKSQPLAAKALRVSERSIPVLMAQYGIVKEKGQYIVKGRIKAWKFETLG